MPSDSSNSAQETNIKQALIVKEENDCSYVIRLIGIGMGIFLVWAYFFNIDQTVKGIGEVITRSRIQIIQSVDGGVLKSLNVKEGDLVKAGQTLANLEQERLLASYNEADARLKSLTIKTIRLRAEIQGEKTLVFPTNLSSHLDLITVERTLFKQRRDGLIEEVNALKKGIQLTNEELKLMGSLKIAGDVNRSEMIRIEKALNSAETQLIVRINKYNEENRTELVKTEGEISQIEQLVMQRKHQLEDSVFVASVNGIVKNVRVTTIGGVLKSGEELMQIIPMDDELIIEAKILPSDIGLLHPGLDVNVRFDAHDYTVYGSVKGVVRYVSADTIKQESANGVESFYRVHVVVGAPPVKTKTGNVLTIFPGMVAQLDIQTGKRSVLTYLLKPLRKTLDKAFTER